MKHLLLIIAVATMLFLISCDSAENESQVIPDSDGDTDYESLAGDNTESEMEDDPTDGDGIDGDDEWTEADHDSKIEDEAVIPPTFIIVNIDSLAEASEEYAAYRRSSGFAVSRYSLSDLVEDIVSPDDLLVAVNGIVQAAVEDNKSDRPVFLMLIGDAYPPWDAEEEQLPVIDCYSSTGDCYTDNRYVDLDDDRVPDAAIGRLPARTPEQVRAHLAKVQTHESSYKTGLWNRRFTLWAGESGFGEQIDGIIEMVTFQALNELNYAFDVIGLYANPGSAYYYTPMTTKIVDLFNAGNLFTVYIGHGGLTGTDGLDVSDLPGIQCEHRLPFSFFFACGNGDFASDSDSIAEAIVWKADGALTSFAGSSATHPYGNAVLPYEVQRAILNIQPATIGEAVWIAKRNVIENDDQMRRIIDNGAEAAGLSAEGELEALRYEHLDLYNLIGDPATALNLPNGQVVFTPGVIQGSVAEGSLTIKGHALGLASGTAYVTLEVKRTMILYELADVDPYNPDPAMVQSNWAKALDKVAASAEVPIQTDGSFSAALEIPEDLRHIVSANNSIIKVYMHDGSNDAIGHMPAE